jgi:hypothetical protein
LRHLLAIDVRALVAQFVAQCAGDLDGELVVQGIDEAADVVSDVADVQVLPLAVTGEEHLEEVADDVGHRVAVRERFVREVVEPTALGVSFDELVRDRGQFVLQPDVRGHVSSRVASNAPIPMVRVTGEKRQQQAAEERRAAVGASKEVACRKCHKTWQPAAVVA